MRIDLVDIATDAPLIEFRGLHRKFGDTHAVRGVSFKVHAGQVFGYIGPNGAGKTTSMRILATLDEPTAGDAFVDGLSVVDDPDRVRRRLGFMPDYYGSYQNVTVREYLDFFARAYGLRGDERRNAISYSMDFTGLEPLSRKPIDGLSKGMKQRLGLGRTMIHDPAVMILDEPAAGLDPRARIELREMIARLAELGKAVLISSHILTELAEICHTVGIIEQGELLAVGSVDEISAGTSATENAAGKLPVGQSTVRVRLLTEASAAAGWLETQAEVDQLTSDGNRIQFEFDDDEVALAAILSNLIQEGFPVIEFGTREKSLEDVFLHVTEGRVQ